MLGKAPSAVVAMVTARGVTETPKEMRYLGGVVWIRDILIGVHEPHAVLSHTHTHTHTHREIEREREKNMP